MLGCSGISTASKKDIKDVVFEERLFIGKRVMKR